LNTNCNASSIIIDNLQTSHTQGRLLPEVQSEWDNGKCPPPRGV